MSTRAAHLNHRALLLAATAQFRWPPASTFVAAYAQDLMAADSRWARFLGDVHLGER